MTVSYCAGVLIGFALNRRITFRFEGASGSALLRYICAYGIGYAINFVGLWLLADHYGIPHEIVQAGMIFGIAVLLFFLQKYWVFKPRRSSHPPRLTSMSASPSPAIPRVAMAFHRRSKS
jgi:putative flippase GtrA